MKKILFFDDEPIVSDYLVKNLQENYEWVGDKEITSKMYSIDVEYATDKFAYAEIPMEAKNSPSLELILLIRGEKYTIILK